MGQTPRPVYKAPSKWWKGLAIFGIWIGVAGACLLNPEAYLVFAPCALIATCVVMFVK